MEAKQILKSDLLDILFEGRNKEYGAYDLRKTYNKRLTKALIGTVVFILLLLIGSAIANKLSEDNSVNEIKTSDVTLQQIKPEEPPPPPPPPPKLPPPPPVATIQFTPPKVVKDEEVVKPPPEIKEIEKAKVDVKTVEGTKDIGIVAPPSDEVGTQVVAAPVEKKEDPDKVFTKVEIEANFPGGPQAWSKYVSRAISAQLDEFTESDYGTCIVRFIVDKTGTVSDVQATTMKGTLLAKLSVDAIKSGPKWVPASQNGHVVAAYRLQPVTLKNTNPETPVNKSTTINTKNDPDKVFIKLEEQASFPGGQRSWLKYISRVFDKNANELMSDKNNLGTCKVRLLVSKDGKVSDVQATTMKGTQLANVAVNAIKKGPEWIPGKQNGKAVNSYIMVPVTFTLSDNVAIKNEPQ